MIPLRIGFDMDGTLANLSAAYAAIEDQLFGAERAEHERPAPEAREEEQHVEEVEGPPPAEPAENVKRNLAERRAAARTGARHRDGVWRVIESTPDFWTMLEPSASA